MGAAPGVSGWRATASCSLARESCRIRFWAGDASRITGRIAGSQTRRLPRVIGTPPKVRSERADLGISDSLVHLHTGALTGLGRRLSTCQTVNSISRE